MSTTETRREHRNIATGSHNRRRPWRAARRLRWTPSVAAFLGYLAAQALIVAGFVTQHYPDSPGYLQLSFTGQAPRLWTVPLLYTIFPTDAWRVAAQAALAAGCWWFVASAASQFAKNRYVRLGLRLVLLALGLVGPIANFNSTILSDSAAMSLTVLVIGCWIRHVNLRTWSTALALLGATLLWTFTRPEIVALGAGVALVAIALGWRHRSRVNAVLAVGLIVISAYGFAIDDRNPAVANQTLADIIEGRVLPNQAWTAWFIAHGMPDSVAIEKSEGGLYGLALESIPMFENWLSAHGQDTYLKFMITHPGYTFLDPLPDFSGELTSINYRPHTKYTYTQPNPTPSILSPDADYGRHRDVLPSVIENLLFQQGQIGDVLLLATGAFGLAWFARRRLGRDRRLLVPLIAVVTVIPQGYVVWLLGGSGGIDRHAMVTAVTARVALWTIAAYALDRILEARKRPAIDASREAPMSRRPPTSDARDSNG